MRTGIHFTVTSGDRQRLQAIVADPKSSQKHVWRARIILKSDEGLGNSSIMAETGKSKTCVWRWQERFMHEGVNGLLRDRSRPPGKAPIPPERVAEIIRLTQQAPPHEATHWTLRAMAKVAGVAASTVQAIWKAHGLSPHRWRHFKLSNDPPSPRSSQISSACMSIRRPMPWCCRLMRNHRSRRSTAPNPACR